MIKKIKQFIETEFTFLRGNLLVLISSQLLMNFSISMIYPFESIYLRELGATPIILGLMGSLSALILALVRIPGGNIADTYGRRNIIIAMTFGTTISYLFYASAYSWHPIIIGIILMGISSIGNSAFSAIQADSMPPEKRGLGYSITTFLPGVLGIASPVISGYLVTTQGILKGVRIGYFVVVFSYIVAVLIRYLYLQETLENPKDFKASNLLGDIKEAYSSIFTIWKNVPRSVLYLTIASILGWMERPLWKTFEVLYVTDYIGVTGFEWGLLSSIIRIVQIAVSIPIGLILDKISRKKAIVSGSILLMVNTLLFVNSQGFAQTLLVYCLFMVFGALFNPAYMALQADLIPRESRGIVIAVIGTLGNLAMVLSSVVSGYLYVWNPKAPFLSTILIEIIVLTIIILLVEEPEEKEK